MNRKHLSVSLIIPAYNEENHIEQCLRAALAQTIPFTEIIVVDNNSTDATVAIVKKFPSVTWIREPRQGVVYARDAGYNAARGDIIARIDGDTILSPDWVENIQKVFADPGVDAVSGSVYYREVCAGKVFDAIDARIRGFLASRMSRLGEHFLYGVNMAMRKTAWQSVRGEVCYERGIHEDLDLAIHMIKRGQKIMYDPHLQVGISVRQADASPGTFYRYAHSSPHAYKKHGMVSQRYMYPVVWLVLALYVPIRMCYRGYDPATGRFSLRCLFYPEVTTGRPSPVAASLTPLE